MPRKLSQCFPGDGGDHTCGSSSPAIGCSALSAGFPTPVLAGCVHAVGSTHLFLLETLDAFAPSKAHYAAQTLPMGVHLEVSLTAMQAMALHVCMSHLGSCAQGHWTREQHHRLVAAGPHCYGLLEHFPIHLTPLTGAKVPKWKLVPLLTMYLTMVAL